MDDSSVGALIGIVMSVVVLGVIFTVTRMGANGDMGRNGAVGIRTKATQRSDEAWRAGHAAAFPVVRTACLLVLVLDLVCLALVFLGPAGLVPWLGIIPLAGILVAVVFMARAAKKGADAAPRAPHP
ncbi:SdpI family protein [Kocuria marina subsp. indica]|uniref:SdpI family protein n=1 Tax=Kocuria marina TaxID=223184 RepID=UPI00103D64E4|nr:SdpI family protein [Kocuria indica]QBJ20555.1 SdpI family protein [Kocuria indica]